MPIPFRFLPVPCRFHLVPMILLHPHHPPSMDAAVSRSVFNIIQAAAATAAACFNYVHPFVTTNFHIFPIGHNTSPHGLANGAAHSRPPGEAWRTSGHEVRGKMGGLASTCRDRAARRGQEQNPGAARGAKRADSPAPDDPGPLKAKLRWHYQVRPHRSM